MLVAFSLLPRTFLVLLSAALTLLLLSGCQSTSYYWQAARGHLSLLSSAEPLDQVIAGADSNTAAKLRLILRARNYAQRELSLSFNDSYTQYVDLGDRHLLQNLYAAPEFSTELNRWCYWFIGCAEYRGYFDDDLLAREAQTFSAQRYDTHIAPVLAYSTLGWFKDPVLSSFTKLPDYQLAGLIFHELAHQEVFASGDTVFNESFATAVEQAGLQRFYSKHDMNQLAAYQEWRTRVDTFTTLALSTRADLQALYDSSLPSSDMRSRKSELITEAEFQYESLTGSSVSLNNASLGAVAAYHSHVDAFLNILSSKGSFPDFYTYVRLLASLPQHQRESCLSQWLLLPAGKEAPVCG